MKSILSILFSLLWFGLFAQVKAPSYFCEEDEIVYEFDVRDLGKLSKDPSSTVQDFGDFDIKNIILSGEYKDWSKDNWSIHRKSRHLYQLRKKLDDFEGDFPQNAKYLIDGKYWHTPLSEPDKKINPASQPDIFQQQDQAVVSETGNQTFFLPGHEEAQEVVLSGSFNNWHEHQIFLKKTSIGWKITMDLPPGIYEYKFIIDGHWIHDPNNKLSVLNPHDTYNSILLIGEDALFTLPGYESAKKVVLSGSFNNWNEHAIEMTKTPRGWACDIPLPPGKHYYKFIIDGNWITDPTNELMQRDHRGYLNSVLLIQ